MAKNNHDDELIKIRTYEKKEKVKKEKPKKEKAPKKEKRSKPKNVPRANGVKLDFKKEEPEVNRYYMAVSKRYRSARYLAVVLLVIYLLVMLIFYRENITYANFVYLARDLDSDTQLNIGEYSDITYERSFDSDYALFRSRIAVASPTGFALYSSTGSKDLESRDVLSDPRLETSEKYAVMYSAGERDYSVFTSIARVFHGECEFEIEDCAVSDTGRYALLTRNDEARFLVTVYNDSFKTLAEYYEDKFVLDVALDSEGENIAIASQNITGSDILGEISLGKVGTKESTTLSFEGMMPIYVSYADDGKLVVLFDQGIKIFDGEDEVASISFGGLAPGYFQMEKNIIAISFPTNVMGSENSLKVYNTTGEELYNETIGTKIVCVATDGAEAVYAVGETRAYCLDMTDGKLYEESLSHQALDAIAVPGSLVICTPDGTASYFTEDKTEP